MKYFAVDRREGNYTILENTETHRLHEVKSSKLPPFLKDGDIVKKVGFGTYEFDFIKTNEARNEVQKIYDDFFLTQN